MFFWMNWKRPTARVGRGAAFNDPFLQPAFNGLFLQPAMPPTQVELSQSGQPQTSSFIDHVAAVVEACVVPVVEDGLRLIAEEVKAQWRRESPGTLALWECGRRQAAEGNQKVGDAVCALAFCLWQSKSKNRLDN